MTSSAVVLYENTENGKFDLQYFLHNHMPLVMKQFSQLGLKSYQVVKFDKGLQDSPAAFTVGALLDWESVESIDNAMTSDAAKEIFADVPSFTNIQPLFLIGNHIG